MSEQSNFEVITKILETSKWAPSPDNLQSWKFKLLSEEHFQVHYKDESDWMVYDINGHATWVTLGFLIECIEISANHYGYSVEFSEHKSDSEQLSIFDFFLTKNNTKQSSETTLRESLFEYIPHRTVQRKLMKTQQLTEQKKQDLQSLLPNDFQIQWLDTFSEKFHIGKLLYGNSGTRYAMKEAYAVHSTVIDWRKGFEQFSPTKIPPKSLGVDPFTVALTKWALAKWERFYVIDKYFAGTVWAKFLMDFLTSLRCGGHFLLTKDSIAVTKIDFIRSGQVSMRLWLALQKMGYLVQPEHTPIMFSELVRNKTIFSKDQRALDNAVKMDKYFHTIVGEDAVNRSVFLARYGISPLPTARSVRKELSEMLID